MPASDLFFGTGLVRAASTMRLAIRSRRWNLVVELVGEGSEVGLGVPTVLQRLEGARHHGLEVTLPGVDPLELGQLPGGARQGSCRLSHAAFC
jgi:hypothetical protein